MLHAQTQSLDEKYANGNAVTNTRAIIEGRVVIPAVRDIDAGGNGAEYADVDLRATFAVAGANGSDPAAYADEADLLFESAKDGVLALIDGDDIAGARAELMGWFGTDETIILGGQL